MYVRHWWVHISSIVVVLCSAWTVSAATNGPGWGPWGMHMMWGSWGMGMMLMMLLFWAVLIVALIFFIRWLVTAGPRGQQPVARQDAESALDILQKRYARGEISKAEFQDMRQELHQKE